MKTIENEFCNEIFAKQIKTKNRNLEANIGKIIQQQVDSSLIENEQPKTTEARIKSLEE